MCIEGVSFLLANGTTFCLGDRKPTVGKGICLSGSGTVVSSLSSPSYKDACLYSVCWHNYLKLLYILTPGISFRVSTLVPNAKNT